MINTETTYVVLNSHGDRIAERDLLSNANAIAEDYAQHIPWEAPLSIRKCEYVPVRQVYARGPAYTPVKALS